MLYPIFLYLHPQNNEIAFDIKVIYMGCCKIFYAVCVVCVLLFSACHSEHVDSEYDGRTVLIYMAADNDLDGDAKSNIRAIQRGMSQISGRLVVYIDPRYDVPRLLTIQKGGRIDTLETYGEEDSASPEVLARVVRTVQQKYPASSYGLLLWSHGLSWIPSEYTFPGAYSMRVPSLEMPRTKYFAIDNHPGTGGTSTYMDIQEMAELLPGHFSYILWDVCFMGAIEVAYEFRNKTDYMIASPAEVISDGFPYEEILPLLWGEEEDLKQICRCFYNYYNEHANGGTWRSATVSLVNTSELEPLAKQVRTLLSGKTDYVQAWRYPLSQGGLPKVFFDFGDYIRNMVTESEYASFKQQLDKTVIYKAATEQLFGEDVPVDKFSGLSSYIPFPQWSVMNAYYSTLDWSKAIYENQ